MNNLQVNNLPVWARIVATIGLPGAIALYLVYQLATGIPATIERHDAASHADMHRVINLLRLVCANTAPDSVSKAGCYTP